MNRCTHSRPRIWEVQGHSSQLILVMQPCLGGYCRKCGAILTRSTGKPYTLDPKPCVRVAILAQEMAASVMGNPHSGWGGPAGFAAIDEEAREATLRMCNAPAGAFVCIFTSGATGEGGGLSGLGA